MKECLDETEHLFRSKKNAKRLLDALESSKRCDGEPQTVRELREEFNLKKT